MSVIWQCTLWLYCWSACYIFLILRSLCYVQCVLVIPSQVCITHVFSRVYCVILHALCCTFSYSSVYSVHCIIVHLLRGGPIIFISRRMMWCRGFGSGFGTGCLASRGRCIYVYIAMVAYINKFLLGYQLLRTSCRLPLQRRVLCSQCSASAT